MHTCFSMVLTLCLAPTTSPADDERLLLGFEKEEMEKIAESIWQGNRESKPPYVVPADPKRKRTAMGITNFQDAYDCHFGWYWGGLYGYLMYVIRKGDATQGEFALVRDFGGGGRELRPYRSPGPWKKDLLSKRPDVYEQYAALGAEYAMYMDSLFEYAQDHSQMSGDRQNPLLYTLRWFDKGFPKDWSGYDVLRVDALSRGADVADLRIGVEDEYVEPLVYRTYEFPAGKWVTLEYDLKEAAEAKRLDTTRMTNLLMLIMRLKGEKPEPTTLALDNIRLAKKGTARQAFR